MTRTPTRRGVQFGPAEQNVLAVIHDHGLRTLRYDGAPKGAPPQHRCPCELVRTTCPGGNRRLTEAPCPAGQKALAGMDHPDAWYRDGQLVAVVHYPYGIDADELREALDGCAELGITLDIDASYAIHAAGATIAVILSRTGVFEVLYGYRPGSANDHQRP